MLNASRTVTIRMSLQEIAEIDRSWRADFTCRSRSEYLRSKIGLEKTIQPNAAAETIQE